MQLKLKKIFILVVLSIANSIICNAQYSNKTWCWGDSAGISFNTNPPSIFTSGAIGSQVSTTISDSVGNLLFYAYGYDYYLQLGTVRSGIVKNKLHQTMDNGDSLIGHWYHDMIIIPKSSVDSTFYIFSAGVTLDYGLWYCIVDLKQNNGLGKIIQKNVRLQFFPVYDGLTAIKHGNGKEWWLIFQKWDPSLITTNNEYYEYKIDSSGISAVTLQMVGSLHNNGAGDLSFNFDGTKLIYAEWKGLIELFDFNRCTGIISNPISIEPEITSNPYPYYSSAIFSPNNRFLYLASYQTLYNHASYLYQYDLTSSNISANRILLDSFPIPEGLGQMEIGPDNKIYISSADESAGSGYPYVIHNYITDNLSVINSPDSFGLACDFQRFSFYLGGNQTYYGLPNNPDYTLGPLVGSPCDTITSVHEIKQQPTQNELKVFYHPLWDIAFINADKLTGRKYTLSLFDITGKLIFREAGNLNSQYYTKDLPMSNFSKGMYIATLETDKERLNKRFAKY